jgi:hypothetical protein
VIITFLETNSVTPREDRPSSSSSSNHNNFGTVHDTNERRSSSAISANGQEVEEQKIEEVNIAGPSEPKILKLDASENDDGENCPVDQKTNSS